MYYENYFSSQDSQDRRRCVLQTGLVYSVFDHMGALQNDQMLVCYFRHEDHVPLLLLDHKNTISFECHTFTSCHAFAKTGEFKFFCNWPLTLASLTSSGSLTAMEVTFWICDNATKVLGACKIDHVPVDREHKWYVNTVLWRYCVYVIVLKRLQVLPMAMNRQTDIHSLRHNAQPLRARWPYVGQVLNHRHRNEKIALGRCHVR